MNVKASGGRYHENRHLRPADVYFGRSRTILIEREDQTADNRQPPACCTGLGGHGGLRVLRKAVIMRFDLWGKSV